MRNRWSRVSSLPEVRKAGKHEPLMGFFGHNSVIAINIYVSLVHCSRLIVNSFVMPIYYKRLEPFNPLVVSGNSWGLIACCQKGRSHKSSPSLLIVGLLFNSSRLCEAAFYSTLLGGFKEVFEELNGGSRSQCEFNAECISSGPLSAASSARAAK